MSKFVLTESGDGWSIHAPGSTDDAIASGNAPVLVCGDYTGTNHDRIPAHAYDIATEVLSGGRKGPVCLSC